MSSPLKRYAASRNPSHHLHPTSSTSEGGKSYNLLWLMRGDRCLGCPQHDPWEIIGHFLQKGIRYVQDCSPLRSRCIPINQRSQIVRQVSTCRPAGPYNEGSQPHPCEN